MKIKKTIAFIIIAVLVIDALVFAGVEIQGNTAKAAINSAQSAAVKNVDSNIIVDGTVTAQNEADLHFQTAGKLVSVPLKEGDKVYEGQTIAQLDTYDLQRQLTTALNTYKTTRDQFDQAQQGQSSGFTQKDQRGQMNLYGAGVNYGVSSGDTSYIDDLAKRIVDENQANLDTSVANVEIAQYALQMATLTSPLTGVVMHEDVDVAGQNVTTSTSFVVADPTTKVFRANIPASDADFVTVGMEASVILDGSQNRINGTVVKIYPSKVTLADGETVYQVDIQSDQITSAGKLDQGGTAIIMTNAQNVTLVPAWTVLGGNSVWVVDSNGKTVLRTISVGATHGEQIEVTGGLKQGDRVITDPKLIQSHTYSLL